MTVKNLDEEYARLSRTLKTLADQKPDGPAKARVFRRKAAEYLAGLSDVVEGNADPCERHPENRALNCAVCRSEQIGRAAWENPDPSTLPDNPISDEEDRKLGEHP